MRPTNLIAICVLQVHVLSDYSLYRKVYNILPWWLSLYYSGTPGDCHNSSTHLLNVATNLRKARRGKHTHTHTQHVLLIIKEMPWSPLFFHCFMHFIMSFKDTKSSMWSDWMIGERKRNQTWRRNIMSGRTISIPKLSACRTRKLAAYHSLTPICFNSAIVV